ncbi:MAG: hypothetical protein [Vetruanivirus porcinprimi]|uniref:Tail fiber protein n=1 Tax=phage Lak_Megaphage_RVC_AP1_GC26 TaxID=3109224 RepID=A0ABZ0Z8F7_9CAUD|nr:MAG: hypothetical protein [phage Lak_Megaphage_RVC_AP1_GC26]
MDYNNKLITELISILDKRAAIAKSELNKALEYVKTYDVSITDYIKSDQQRQTDDYTGKINELTENTKDSFKLIGNEIDRKLGENKQENINAINSAKNDLIIKLDNFKSDANTYTDTNINIVKDKIDGVDTKYNNIITTLSDAYNTSFDDVYDKIKTGIDTLYFKYDASMKEYDTRIDSSFRTILQYINTSVAILRNQTLTNAKILEDNLNASINRIKGLIDIDIDDLYTYIDDQLDDIDKEQLIQNTSINKIKSDVDIKYEYLLALINKSSGEMGDVTTEGIAGLRKEFKEFKSDTTERFNLVNNDISLIHKDVSKIDTSLNDHIKKFNEHVSKSDNYIIDNNKNIQNIQTKIGNIEVSYNNLNTDVTNLITNFNTLVNSDNANNVIDTFKEVETFLSSISDASTLTGILEQMSTEMNKKIDNIIKNDTSINVPIDDINSSIIDISSRLYNYITSNNEIITKIDTSINDINSSINNLITKIDTSINDLNSSIDDINSSINDISTRLNNNYVSKDDYIKDEEVITTAFVQLDNKINDIDTSINANIIDISTRLNNKISLLESNNIIKLNTTSGTNKNIWNEENNTFYDDAYVIDINKFNIVENGIRKEKELKTVNPNIINEIISNKKVSNNLFDNINSSISNINASINDINSSINDISIDVLSTEYINELNQETTSGFNTLGTCLDFILSSMYYTKPVDLNVTFTAAPTSIIKGKETNVVFTYVINNYKNNISNIVYNNNVLSDLTYAEHINVTDNISRTLRVETNYKDNKGASPAPFNRTITVSAIQELYYWSSVDSIYENNYTVENKPNWNTYTYKSNTYSINFNNQGEDKYIFFVTSSDIPETKFFIYQHGSSPTLSGGIKKIGIITIQLYNIPLNYYLYRTNNVLGGDYDIKW